MIPANNASALAMNATAAGADADASLAMTVTSTVVAEEPAPCDTDGNPWLWIGLTIVLIALAITALAVVAKYLRIGVHLFLDTPLPVTPPPSEAAPPEGEIVMFPNREGRSLRGMFIDRPPGAPHRGVVLFCHEFGSDMMSAGRYGRALIDAGYTVFTFDFRGHGQSFTPPHFEPRHWPSNHDVNDILSAIAYVRTRCDLGPQGLGIVGVSRGGGAAIIAAALTPHIRCMVVDGAFSTDHSVDELLKRYGEIFLGTGIGRRISHSPTAFRTFRTLLMFYGELKCRCRFPSTRRALTKLDGVPILFIQGERDTYIRTEQTQALVSLKPGPKALWICPKARHNQAVTTDPATYARKLTEFFEAYLAAPTPSSGGNAPGRMAARP